MTMNYAHSTGSQTAARCVAAAFTLVVISAYGGTEENVPRVSRVDYSPNVGQQVPRQVYWGDTHLHTANSGDAFGLGAMLGPVEEVTVSPRAKRKASSGPSVAPRPKASPELAVCR